jgi:hypothetical protein
MKRTILFIVVLVVACTISSLLTYRITYHTGLIRTRVCQQGTVVGAMDALEKLKAGQTDEGTRRIESLCFSAANALYEDPNCRDYFVTKTFAAPLIHYRDTYRTNRAEWTPAEERLEGLLASWR